MKSNFPNNFRIVISDDFTEVGIISYRSFIVFGVLDIMLAYILLGIFLLFN